MAINKIVYGQNALIDLTNDTVTGDVLLSGYTAHDKHGNVIHGTYEASSIPTIDLAECMRTGVWPEEYTETFYDEEVGNVESISGQFILENDLHYGMNNNAGVLYISQINEGDVIRLSYFRAELLGSSIQLNSPNGYIEFSSESPQFEHHVYNPYVDYFVCVYCVVDTIDTSDGNITAETVLKGYVGYANEERIVGEYEPPTPEYDTPSINISSSGLITASANGKSGIKQLTTQSAKTVTPTESEQTAVSSGVYTTGDVKVGAISSTYIGSGVQRRSSSDLTVSGDKVTVPSGYYQYQSEKAVASGGVTVNKPTINSSGLVTASATVSAGYVSSDPSNNTLQLTTKAGTTITPSSSQQTAISSGTYATGNILVSAVPTETKTVTENGTVTPSSGKYLSSVTVSIPIQKYYTGSSTPASSLGSNGDLYLKM